MTKFGKALTLLVLLSTPSLALAALTAQVDRLNVALGDSVRLTISASDDEELSDIDLAPLERDFDILRRSTSSNISIVNGKRTHEKKLVIDMAPLREGDLIVPGFRAGNSSSAPLRVRVGPAPDQDTGANPVLFEAELDSKRAYVQGQVLLTLRIQQAIELESMSVSELELDGAFVKPLESREFYRTVNGRNWRVHELRYAIFPEQSGELVIPGQVFTARATEGRRSIFSRGTGRLLRRSTEAVTIEVQPRPTQYPQESWLPARQLKIEERWSTPPESLRAGESATRTITLIGEGVQGAQLPPVLYPPTDGLKFYPDQPEITEQEVSSGLLGSRRDSAAIVPMRAGNWTLPEIRIAWWDTQTDQLRYATLPARSLQVAPAQTTANPQTPATGAPETAGTAQLPAEDNFLWQTLFGISTVGWLITLACGAWLWRRQQGADQPRPQGTHRSESERRLMKQVRSACAAGDAAMVRDAVLRWASAVTGNRALRTLDAVAAQFGDATLTAALRELDRHLYGTDKGTWQNETLPSLLDKARDQQNARNSDTANKITLYPTASKP